MIVVQFDILHVLISLYTWLRIDVRGQEVASLVDEWLEIYVMVRAFQQTIQVDGTGLLPGTSPLYRSCKNATCSWLLLLEE